MAIMLFNILDNYNGQQPVAEQRETAVFKPELDSDKCYKC